MLCPYIIYAYACILGCSTTGGLLYIQPAAFTQSNKPRVPMYVYVFAGCFADKILESFSITIERYVVS